MAIAAAPDTPTAWLNELFDARAAADEAAAEPGGAVAALDQAAEERKQNLSKPIFLSTHTGRSQA